LIDENNVLFEVDALIHLLEKEYEFLKSNQIEAFEALQKRKQELLEYLLSENLGKTHPSILKTKKISEKITKCQNLQKRNEILINGKLSMINEVLKTLGIKKSDDSTITYEHLNKKR
jgi:flagellar biosynthesis/type III secretory pathway chaperone